MTGEKHFPERTCIGCRAVFKKSDVIRVVAGPAGIVIDYREKMAGRAAYVCPDRECIKKALTREALAKSLRSRTVLPSLETFLEMLKLQISEKIRSLVVMAAKAGKLAAGYSAVKDSIEKNRVQGLIFAVDLSDGTREKILHISPFPGKEMTFFTKEEMGAMLGRETVGILGIEDKGFNDRISAEMERLNNLISTGK